MLEDNTFIKYTRALHTNPNYKSLSYEYRHIFLTILVNMAFEPMELNDHGILIKIKPGQLMITLRGLVKLCDEEGISKGKVERALKMFENIGFSRQETRHTKTVITITEPSICSVLKNNNKTEIETRSGQDRDKIGTEKKNDKNYKNKRTTTTSIDETPIIEDPKRVVVFYECLKENKCLSDDEKEYLQRFDEARVQLAIKFAEEETPKTSLIAMLVWHCQQKVPPVASKRKFTDQQRMAMEFNSYLLSIGQELIYRENKNFILEGYMVIPLNRCPTTISLNNPTTELKKDFEQVKAEQRKLKYG